MVIPTIRAQAAGGAIPAGQWQHVSLPLSELGITEVVDVSDFLFQSATGSTQERVFLDEIRIYYGL